MYIDIKRYKRYSTRPTLKKLPSEIIILILQYCSTPENLQSALQASPIFYRVFLENKAAIRAEIAYGAFHPSTLPLALVICKANFEASVFFNKHVFPNVNLTFLYLMSTGFLFNDDPNKPCLKRSRQAKVGYSLFRLWRIVDRCIKDYIVHASSHMSEKATWKRTAATPGHYKLELSRSEYYRLQRAFLYLELYRRLFGRIDAPGSRSFYLTKLSWTKETLLTCLSDLEQLELWSVYCYLKFRMSNIFNEVDEHLMFTFKTVEVVAYDSRTPYDFVDCVDLPSAKSLILNSSRVREARIDFLIELGLPFCIDFFDKTVREQASLVLQYTRHRCVEPLKTTLGRAALKYKQFSRVSKGTLAYNAYEHTLPGAKCIPVGIKGVQKVYKTQEKALNGYFFWDMERIENTSFQKQKSDHIITLRRLWRVNQWEKRFKNSYFKKDFLKDSEILYEEKDPSYEFLEDLEY